MRARLPGWLRRHLAGYLLILPACLLVLGTIGYPLVYTVALSFTDAHDFNGPGAFAGLDNFRTLFGDGEFWDAVRNTLVLTGLTIALELVIGVSTALLLWWKFRLRSLVFLFVFVPWVFPAAFSGFAWFILFKPPFHTFYTTAAVSFKDAIESLFGDSAYYFATVLTFNVWRCSSFVAVFLLAGLNGIPREQLEYARLESGSPWQQFWRVLVPLLRRFLVLAVLTSIVITFMDYSIIYIQTGGLIFQPLLGTLAYRTSILAGDTGVGAAITVLQLPFFALLLAVCFRLFEREPRAHAVERETLTPLSLEVSDGSAALWLPLRQERGDDNAALGLEARRDPLPLREERANDGATARLKAQRAPLPLRHERGDDDAALGPQARGVSGGQVPMATGHRVRWRLRRRLLVGLGAVAVVLLSVFHILPIYWTVIQAIRPLASNVDSNPFWVQHPSLDGFTEPLRDRAFWTWMQNTAVVFGAALVLALASSVLAGYALARLRVPGARWLARLLLASYFVPQIAVLVPIYQLFIWLNISDSFLGVILLYQTLTIPFCTWLFYTFYATLPPDTEEAALLDGSRVQAFLRLTLRMSWPVLVTGLVFCVGMMASDLLYAGTFLIHHDQQTVTVGLAVISVGLGEFSQATGGIGIAALPIVVICLLFAPAYVRGLTMAMDEGA